MILVSNDLGMTIGNSAKLVINETRKRIGTI